MALNFTDAQWDVMTQWEKEFVNGVNQYCDKIGSCATDKQLYTMDLIYERTLARIARRESRLEE